MAWLTQIEGSDVQRGHADPVDARTLAQAAEIVEDVRARGDAAVRETAHRLGDLARVDEPLVAWPHELQAALEGLEGRDRRLLERTAARIRTFAEAQRRSLHELEIPVAGGSAGHRIDPVDRAGCYAPGGRFPLPSSVLMTAVTARTAGVKNVWVASPRPTPVTLAAAAVAGADAVLRVGGAQAIAALAYGTGEVPRCDVVVGPGNRWVTAAKQIVSGHVAIDMLAGPSELVILADGNARADVVAADLLAQAEHDPEAFAALVTCDRQLAQRVQSELDRQIRTLPTAETAKAALRAHGTLVLVTDLTEGVEVCNLLAPEHLELHVADADRWLPHLRHYGALFIGSGAAEVFGDYGAGPNHVLPTGRTARFSGGLSVLSFLRVRTYLRTDRDDVTAVEVIEDAAHLARLEGLEAHARAALFRRHESPEQ